MDGWVDRDTDLSPFYKILFYLIQRERVRTRENTSGEGAEREGEADPILSREPYVVRGSIPGP